MVVTVVRVWNIFGRVTGYLTHDLFRAETLKTINIHLNWVAGCLGVVIAKDIEVFDFQSSCIVPPLISLLPLPAKCHQHGWSLVAADISTLLQSHASRLAT